MTYIILAAGKGSNLQPLTLKYPKTSYKLDDNTTVLQRMVRKIRSMDKKAEIVVVIGYLGNIVRKNLEEENVKFVVNPFYEVTNSIASIWFAREYLERENIAIMHGDIVFEDYIIKNYLVQKTEFPYVLVDSTCLKAGNYNAVIKDEQILVMSKKLETFDAKYCCTVIRNLPVRQKITLGIGTPLTDCCTGCRIRIADKDDKSMRIRQYGGRICLNRKLCTGIKRSRFICVDIFIVTVIFLSYKT